MNNQPLWSLCAPTLSLPALTTDIRTDICVIGLGGSGLACLTELTEAGREAIGVDGGVVAGGAAGRNGGFLLGGTAAFYHDAVEKHGRDNTRRWHLLTLKELDRIAAETPDAVRRHGSLRIAADEEEWLDCRRQLAAMQADGLGAEEYEGPEGRGLLFPDDGVFNPLRRCRSVAQRLLDKGVPLFERSPVHAIDAGDTLTVITAQGRIHCRHVVVAVDGNLEKLLPELQGRLRTARLQMLGTAPAPEVEFTRPVYRRYGYDYWQQLDDKSIALGGLRDRFVEREWTDSAEPVADLQVALETLLRQVLKVNAAVTHRWAASVGYTSDGLPFVGVVRPNVWALGGYCGTGNIVGSISGRAVAQAICRRESAFPRDLSGPPPLD